MDRRALQVILVVVALAALFSLSALIPEKEVGPPSLTIAACASDKELLENDIIPAFRTFWLSRTGVELEIKASYRGSREQVRALLAGYQADVVMLSWAGDIHLLVESGMIDQDWDKNHWNGIRSCSYIVAAARRNNPLEIKEWRDLIREDVNIVLPDPNSSGAGIWCSAALYAALGADSERALGRAVLMDSDSIGSMTSFSLGVGNVALMSHEVIVGAKLAGESWEKIVLSPSVLIEHPIAVTKAGSGKLAAYELVKFLRNPDSQLKMARRGYLPPTRQSLHRRDLRTIEEIGGWDLFGLVAK